MQRDDCPGSKQPMAVYSPILYLDPYTANAACWFDERTDETYLPWDLYGAPPCSHNLDSHFATRKLLCIKIIGRKKRLDARILHVYDSTNSLAYRNPLSGVSIHFDDLAASGSPNRVV